jgi:hypothetical protein
MKKIIISGVALLLVVAGFSQQSSTSPNNSDAANLERIRQNQIKNKAAEDALKQQQNNKKAILPSDVVTISASDVNKNLQQTTKTNTVATTNGTYIDPNTKPVQVNIAPYITGTDKAGQTIMQPASRTQAEIENTKQQEKNSTVQSDKKQVDGQKQQVPESDKKIEPAKPINETPKVKLINSSATSEVKTNVLPGQNVLPVKKD